MGLDGSTGGAPRAGARCSRCQAARSTRWPRARRAQSRCSGCSDDVGWVSRPQAAEQTRRGGGAHPRRAARHADQARDFLAEPAPRRVVWRRGQRPLEDLGRLPPEPGLLVQRPQGPERGEVVGRSSTARSRTSSPRRVALRAEGPPEVALGLRRQRVGRRASDSAATAGWVPAGGGAPCPAGASAKPAVRLTGPRRPAASRAASTAEQVLEPEGLLDVVLGAVRLPRVLGEAPAPVDGGHHDDGDSRVRGSARSRRATSKPWMRGSMASRRTRDGGRAATGERLLAVARRGHLVTFATSARLDQWRISGSSSTTRIFAPTRLAPCGDGGGFPPPRAFATGTESVSSRSVPGSRFLVVDDHDDLVPLLRGASARPGWPP